MASVPAVGVFSPSTRLIKFGEVQVLQVGVGRHQRLLVQPSPRLAFEVAEAEFLLHRLVGLLAYLARLDRADERASRRPGRQIREVDFALARGAPLANQPDLRTRQVPVVGPCRAVAELIVSRRLQALARTQTEKAAHVERRPAVALLVPHRGEEGRQPRIKPRIGRSLRYRCLPLLSQRRTNSPSRSEYPGSAKVRVAGMQKACHGERLFGKQSRTR